VAYKLEVGIPSDDGKIRVMHTFFGDTRAECLKLRDAHADVCPNFGPAVKADDVTEDFEEVDEEDWPSVDGDDEDDDD
jgi:hypothetical protein